MNADESRRLAHPDMVAHLRKKQRSMKDMPDEQWHMALQQFQSQHTVLPAGGLVMFAVYERPADSPQHWVVRRWELLSDGSRRDGEAYGFKTLEDARTVMPMWATVVPRQPGDDPILYETWL